MHRFTALIAGFFILTAASQAALAQSSTGDTKAPATPKECIALLDNLGKLPGMEKASQDTMQKVIPMGKTMNDHCQAGRFKEALGTYSTIIKVVSPK